MNRIIKTIVFFLVVIGLIWLIIVLFSKAFSTSKTATTARPKVDLLSYAATDAVSSVYIDGPVQANQDHQALKISVDKNQVKIELYRGYQREVVKQAVYPNNPTSYASFLKSLDKAQFARSVSANVGVDERGYCPLRNRFIYELNNETTSVVRAWTTSCGVGNYTGDRALTRTLFIDQVPDKELRTFLNGTNFSTI